MMSLASGRLCAGQLLTPGRLSATALALGLGAVLTEPILMLAKQSWSEEQAEQGPLVLLVGCWLTWRCWPMMTAQADPPSAPKAAALLAVPAVAYVFALVCSVDVLLYYSAYAILLSGLYALFGGRGLREGMLPLILLSLCIPMPFFLGWPLTNALRLEISNASLEFLRAFGVSAAREGLALYVSGYRIEMAQACSGMSSIASLSAMGLCYVYLRRGPFFWYFVAGVPALMGIAVLANTVRVLCVVGATLELGDVAAQGTLHLLLGLVCFSVAMIATIILDAGAFPLWRAVAQRRNALA